MDIIIVGAILLVVAGIVGLGFSISMGIEQTLPLLVISVVIIATGIFLCISKSAESENTDVKIKVLNYLDSTKDIEIKTNKEGYLEYKLIDSTYQDLFNYLNKEKRFE